ncbi:MAG TPA: AAA family ATPase [Steroidobacteraceae bacterium]|jgi:DNA-binding winged helix-turn-helix (wHTH) protein
MKVFPPFRLDTDNQCLWRRSDTGQEERVLLAPKAFAVLVHLVEHAGYLVTHDELLEAVWPGSVVEPQAVKKHVLTVRSALGDRPKNPVFIETMPRRGYRFIAAISEQTASTAFLPGRTAQGALVGRGVAIEELQLAWHSALSGERQIVFVTGEPGIGKTTLVERFRDRVASTAHSIRIAQGQCVEGYGGKEPYYPVLDALGRLCRGATGQVIVQILAMQAPTWLVQFPALLKPEHREALQRELLGATRERMLREMGEALESITADHPVLLIFEDLQWVDDSTVDLISALARRKAPARFMLVATFRPLDLEPPGHPMRSLMRDLLAHRLCRDIDLTSLSEAEVEEYLTAQSPASRPPDGLSALLHRHSEGNPLFMVAALDHMTKESLLSRENGGWQLRVPLSQIELAVPADLRHMIEAQLERLSAEEQSALELASIAGVSFSASVVSSAAEVDPRRFEDLCEELSRRHQLVRWAGTQHFPDGTTSERYEFVHALYRQVLCDRQAPGRRAKLHRRIGERLEAMYSQRMQEVVPELAYHFEAAADWPRAVDYLHWAADIAGDRYAHRQADSILERALELVNSLPQTQRPSKEIDLLVKLAANRAAALDMRASDTYEMLAARAAHYGLIDIQLRALTDLSKLLAFSSRERCLEVVQRALQLCATQDPLIRTRTLASCAFSRVAVGGWFPQDAQEHTQALAQLSKTDDAPTLAPHLIEESYIRFVSGGYREAHRLAIESRAGLSQRSVENPYVESLLTISLLYMGEWGEALRELAATIAQAQKNGDYHSARLLRLLAAWVHTYALDFRGALVICEQALPLERDRAPHVAPDSAPAYPIVFRMALICTGTAAVALGDFDRALEDLSTARSDMGRQTAISDWYWSMPLASGMTELWLAKGDRVRARLEAERFLDMALATAEPTWQGLAWEVNARLALVNRDHARARDCIATAVSTVQSFEVPLAAWRVHATAADIAEQLGNEQGAHSHRELSRIAIQRLASSLSENEPLRMIFLSAPVVTRILDMSS